MKELNGNLSWQGRFHERLEIDQKYHVMQISEEKYLKIYKFLMIHQNFPYQIFLLATANVMPDTILSVLFSMPIRHYFPCQKLSP